MPSFQWYSSAKHPPGQRRTGMFEVLQRGDDVVADAAGVGDRRSGPDPDAFVDAAAQVLGEVAVHVAVDDRTRRVGAQRRGRLDDRAAGACD